MTLVAIKDHTYRGKRYKIGQTYLVLSPADARILKLAGLAKEDRKVNTETVMASHLRKDPEIVAATEGRIYETQEIIQASDTDSLSRPRKRRYKRHDMVPEE